ncbi:hypothetical protein EDD86DRAFT_215000, partial [Gorgonomyces haynaldii]
MRYFSSFLEDTDISELDVHCDVQVFEWLLNYISNESLPIDMKNVISILISSHFLMMEPLEDKCLQFVSDHLQSVVMLPIDLGCIQERLIEKLSLLVDDETLSDLLDPNDKLKTVLYQHKLKNLLMNRNIGSCVLCKQVFTLQVLDSLDCKSGQCTLGLDGTLTSKHTLDPEFDVNQYIVAMYISTKSWELVYWRCWGIVHHLECTKCKNDFVLVDLLGCLGHLNTDKRMYPCCKRNVYPFTPFQKNGCMFFSHEPERCEIYDKLHNQMEKVLWTQNNPTEAPEYQMTLATNRQIDKRPTSKKRYTQRDRDEDRMSQLIERLKV